MRIKLSFYISTLLFLIINFICTISYSQNGTYRCASQGYSTSDNAVNKLYSAKQLIIIDINNLNGGEVTINTPADEYIIKYSIAKTREVLTDTKERTITRTYDVYLVMMGEKINKALLAIVENMDTENISMWIYNEKYKAYNTYLNLKRITN
ncbi:hypothetical protein [Pedobacter sp. MW01-1-1]|uniref:hypothetical protein n=1 Tax=Pedobacter sp. MW01-1-1 TaxID=3383027 RepID=UPI003FF13A68